jgi:hypothetical protein
MNEDWDYLIVLDACRYDYFEKVWQKYLPGKLCKRLSVGSSTLEWRDKSFAQYYGDVVYVSSNPYISQHRIRNFAAEDHFYKVYDLWNEGWDEKKGTVLPETVTYKAIEVLKKHPGKRFIIHYMQPHEPYLTPRLVSRGYASRLPVALYHETIKRGSKMWFVNKLQHKLFTMLCAAGLEQRIIVWKLREILGLPPVNPMDVVRRKYGSAVLREAYSENLELVLTSVSELLRGLSGRIIVCADHGDMLGEGGHYGHWPRSSKKLLIEIPWLVIEQGPRPVINREHQDKHKSPEQKTGQGAYNGDEKVKQRLKTLGYY